MTKLLPGSLFGRLLCLLTILIFMVFLILSLLFQYDRDGLLITQFGFTKAVQLQALRKALTAAPRDGRPDILKHFAQTFDAQIFEVRHRVIDGDPIYVPVLPVPLPSLTGTANQWLPFQNLEGNRLSAERELLGQTANLESYLKRNLGADTLARLPPDRKTLWIRFSIDDAKAVSGALNGATTFWTGFPMPKMPPLEDLSSRAFFLALIVIGVLVLFAFAFARYLTQPLSKLARAVNMVGRGEYPPPLPHSGPSEYATLNRGFNAMTARLRQVDEDRALLLAGVSHDLRTPLARIRLSVEMNVKDDAERELMNEDIDVIDRIIDQFLEFTRSDNETKPVMQDANALIESAVKRFQRDGKDVTFKPDPQLPQIPLRTTPFERLIQNLINNSLNHGKPPVDLTTGHNDDLIWINVMDHGAGFPKTDRNRLKEPFRRASEARTTAEGQIGAGLGLAIVDRIVRLHHGKFELLDAPHGGAWVRVMLPR